ncbi:hypothetical protein [Siphonobacter sp.]|uniref:hypothetical protein n=1 Tax=Siphonobacter sp. TaxID=1869184 RepID=UPI003B3AF311
MNRSEKLQTLELALSGNTSRLERLKEQKRREALPFIAVWGILSFYDAPVELLGHEVYFSNHPSRRNETLYSLQHYLDYFRSLSSEELRGPLPRGSMLIQSSTNALDHIALDYIGITGTDHEERYTTGTIADLKRFNLSNSRPVLGEGIVPDVHFIPILLYLDKNEFDWFSQRPFIA